jgi:hypothetical protein
MEGRVQSLQSELFSKGEGAMQCAVGQVQDRTRAPRPLSLSHLLVGLHLHHQLQVDGGGVLRVLGLADQQAAAVFVHTAVPAENSEGQEGEHRVWTA